MMGLFSAFYPCRETRPGALRSAKDLPILNRDHVGVIDNTSIRACVLNSMRNVNVSHLELTSTNNYNVASTFFPPSIGNSLGEGCLERAKGSLVKP